MTPLRRDLADLLRLALPVVGTRLGAMAMGLIDTVVVGRYSAVELGYMALAWTPGSAVLTAGFGLLSGIQVLTARRLGEGRLDEAGAVLRRGVVYAVWVGLIGAAVLTAFGPAFLVATGIEADLARGAAAPLRIFSLSLLPAMIGVACSSWLEASGRPQAALWAMWIANGFNLAIDLVLVPGAFGLHAMGAVGAAWGTFGARTALMLALIALILATSGGRKALTSRPPRDRPAEAEQRRIGYGAGAAFFAEAGAFTGMNIVAGLVGGLAVAGWAVVLNFTAIVFMLPLGIAVATSVLAAKAHGAGDAAGVARAGGLGLGVSGILAGVVALATWPGARLVAGAYTTDPALILMAVGAIQLACLFFVADALQVVAAQLLRACGDVLTSTWVQIGCYAVVMLPLGWALAVPAGLGLTGIMLAVILASFMSAGLLVARFAWLARPHRVG